MKTLTASLGYALSARAVAVTIATLAVGASFACTSAEQDDAASSESAQTADGGVAPAPAPALRSGSSLAVPRAGTDENMLAEAEVLAALKKVKAAFYDSQSGYVPAGTVVGPAGIACFVPPGGPDAPQTVVIVPT